MSFKQKVVDPEIRINFRFKKREIEIPDHFDVCDEQCICPLKMKF